jgi:hypothetical protein
LARLVGETLTSATGLDPSFFGVGRGELLSSKTGGNLREELGAIGDALGCPMGDIYVGGSDASRVAAFHGKKDRVTWVLGPGVDAPLDTPRRYLAGRVAFATHAGSIAWLDRAPEEGALLLMAAAAAADVSLPAAGGFAGMVEWTRAVGKAMPRKVRKAVAELAPRLPQGGATLATYCAAAQQSAERAGLITSGDLHGSLAYLLGRDPRLADVEANASLHDLVMFWTSREALALRRELGLTG